MKKLLALLLAAVMVLSLAACGGTNTDPTQAPTDGATEPTEAPTETPTDAPTTPVARENKLIFGTNTDVTGDWTTGIVTNGASDMMISSMINDYGTLVTNQEGNYVENKTVLKSWERKDNEDGSATYTISINEGLVYNNGEPITIKDYAFKLLLLASPAGGDMQFTDGTSTTVVGGEDYRAGTTDVLPGVKMVDEYTMELSIVPDYAQYYYADTYAGITPGTSPTGLARAMMWLTMVKAATLPRTARRSRSLAPMWRSISRRPCPPVLTLSLLAPTT